MNENNISSKNKGLLFLSYLLIEGIIVYLSSKFIRYYLSSNTYYIFPLFLGFFIAVINQILLLGDLYKLIKKYFFKKGYNKFNNFKNISDILEYKIKINDNQIKKYYYSRLIGLIKKQALYGGILSVSFFMSSTGIYSVLELAFDEDIARYVNYIFEFFLIMLLIINIDDYKKAFIKKDELKYDIEMSFINYGFKYFKEYIKKRDEICFICRNIKDSDELFKEAYQSKIYDYNYYKVLIEDVIYLFNCSSSWFSFLEFNAIAICEHCKEIIHYYEMRDKIKKNMKLYYKARNLFETNRYNNGINIINGININMNRNNLNTNRTNLNINKNNLNTNRNNLNMNRNNLNTDRTNLNINKSESKDSIDNGINQDIINNVDIDNDERLYRKKTLKILEKYYGKELIKQMETVCDKIENDEKYEMTLSEYKEVGDYYRALIKGIETEKPIKLKNLEHMIWDPIFKKYNINK